MAKNKSIEVMCNKEEYNRIFKKAESSGLAISTYLRLLGLKSEVRVITG